MDSMHWHGLNIMSITETVSDILARIFSKYSIYITSYMVMTHGVESY